MLTQDRHSMILNLLEKKSSVTLTELIALLNTSESTIRRDLTALDKEGKLHKVYGGATSLDFYSAREEDIRVKQDLHMAEKNLIAKKAAGLVERNDLVYIDAGTTTELLIDYLTQRRATYVTNGTAHASKLADKGFTAFIIAGQLKKATAAIIGTSAVESLRSYNFTKGFFGTNGISIQSGFSTPDPIEASVKKAAMRRCQKAYILADSAKFDKITPITFADLREGFIITDILKDKRYSNYTKILEVCK